MVSATIGKDHYTTELTANGHRLVADEPLEVGGKNGGPAPGDYLQLSLAACTAITLRMYVDRKQWSVEKIRVEISTEKNGDTTIFTRHLSVEGEINEEQRTRLLQIANACPIHKTLTNPIEIKTRLQ